MKRFRDRLRLTSRVSAQNEIIRRSLHELHEIGYLQYHEEKVGRNIKFHILKRSPSLGAKKEPILAPAQNDSLLEKLKMMKAAGFTGEEIAAVLVSIDKMKKINGTKNDEEAEDADFSEE